MQQNDPFAIMLFFQSTVCADSIHGPFSRNDNIVLYILY
jgi:hypothetical protein